MRVDFFKEIPGLSEAVSRENATRDAAFLDIETDICGIKIRQMTSRDLLILDGLDNGLVQGRTPTGNDIAHFLWRLSPSHRENAPIRRWFFVRRVRRLVYSKAVEACERYLNTTFQDSPGGGVSRPFASWVSHIVDLIASTYGWGEETILNEPLRRIFQYERCIRRHNNPEAILHNASDRLVGDFLRTRNQKPGGN